MKRHLNDSEVTAALKRMQIICDTRERENKHILDYLESRGIALITRRIKTGDYSAQLDDLTIEDEVVIERKSGLDELANNVSNDRQRFEDEFLRAKANGVKIFLLVENAEWRDIADAKYRSKVNAHAFEATLCSWQVRFNITIMFTPRADAGRRLYEILWYFMRERIAT
jgi:ERCC4-type nuclease